MVELCENRMLIFAFCEKRFANIEYKRFNDSSRSKNQLIWKVWNVKVIIPLTKSILLCADLTREQWFFNLPKTMFAKLYFCFEISVFCTICKWLISKLTFLGRGIIAKYSSSCYGTSLTLYSHKHHLHAKYKYGGASNITYLYLI